ncbi:MAG: site-specific integrase [Acidiferrobacterales bacterium]
MDTNEQARFDALYGRHRSALTLQGKADKTIEAYSRTMRAVAQFFDRCPDDLSEGELTRYFAQRGACSSWSAVKIDRNGLAFFYKHVVKREMPWITMLKAPKVTFLPEVLTPCEIGTIVARTRDLRFRSFWFVSYSMGLRLGEVVHLQVGDIDRARMLVHIRCGKGRRDRFVILPERTLQVLGTLWRSHRHRSLLFPGNPKSAADPIVHSMDRGTTQRAFGRVVRDCGIHKRVSIHSLRHRYATHLIEIGLNLRAVQQQLGHASPETTAKYVHMTDVARGDHRELINRLADRVAPSLQGEG